MDKATWAGLIVAVGGIIVGLLLEGGNLGQILQPTAAMIVFGEPSVPYSSSFLCP